MTSTTSTPDEVESNNSAIKDEPLEEVASVRFVDEAVDASLDSSDLPPDSSDVDADDPRDIGRENVTDVDSSLNEHRQKPSSTRKSTSKSSSKKTRIKTDVREIVEDEVDSHNHNAPSPEHDNTDYRNTHTENLGDNTAVDEEEKKKPVTKSKKKKKKSKRKRSKSKNGTHEDTSKLLPQEPSRHVEVVLHKADKLRLTKELAAPVVMISFFNSETGELIQPPNVDFCGPVGESSAFDFCAHRSLAPAWEESVVVGLDYDTLIMYDDTTIIFELCGAPTSTTQDEWGGASNMPLICWGFLKLKGSSGLNTEQQARLQLYEYTAATKRMPTTRSTKKRVNDDDDDGGGPSISQPWADHIKRLLLGPRRPYPSTLYISIYPTLAKKTNEDVVDSRAGSEHEDEDYAEHLDLGRLRKPMWLRLPGQKCLVPDSLQREIPHEQGCYTLAFSNDGSKMAAGCEDHDSYLITIYHVFNSATSREMVNEDIAVLYTLEGHLNIVQDVHWSANDELLISASSDSTARLWSTADYDEGAQLKILPHPCFVYSARLLTDIDDPDAHLAFTGAYDGVIRLWDLSGEGNTAKTISQLHQHEYNVNTLALDQQGLKLFSGDAKGVIIIWARSTSGDWDIAKRIETREIAGYPINRLEVHPSGRRLLVHVRDNIVRMLDLRTNAFMQRYHGSTNQRTNIRGSLSGCGGFVVAGSEDGTAHMWNADTGDMVYHFSDLLISAPVHDARFHPHDHLVAFCSFGVGQPILVYRHAKNNQGSINAAIQESKFVQFDTGGVNDTFIDSKLARLDSSLPHTGSPLNRSLVAPLTPLHEHGRNTLLPPLRPELRGMVGSARLTPSATPKRRTQFAESPMTLPNSTIDGDDFVGLADLQEQREAHVENLLSQATSTLEARRAALHDQARTPVPLFSTEMDNENTSQDDGTDLYQSGSSPLFKKRNKRKDKRKNRNGDQTMSIDELQEPEQFRATHKYDAMRGDELSFEKGDALEIFSKGNSMWWSARKKNGDRGLVPANFLRQRRGGKSGSSSQSLASTLLDSIGPGPATSTPMGTPTRPQATSSLTVRKTYPDVRDESPTAVSSRSSPSWSETTKRTTSAVGSALRETRRHRRARRLANDVNETEV